MSSSSSSSSSSDDKLREYMDKVNSGEIPMGFTEVRTSRTDEGTVSSAVGGLCGPCRIGKHRECQMVGCTCTDPYHHHQEQGQEQAH